jgi:hypothetical protein
MTQAHVTSSIGSVLGPPKRDSKADTGVTDNVTKKIEVMDTEDNIGFCCILDPWHMTLPDTDILSFR